MTIEPFAARVVGGRLFGRGACDVKGGMAAMLAALVRLSRRRPAGMPTLILACTVNEEYGFTGAKALTRLWQDDPGGIIPRRPDCAIVAEPTSLDVVVAHKGVLRWRVHTHGRAAHGAQPEQGDNAIYRMGRVLDALQRYHGQVLPERGGHPRCGMATLNVGTIQGGLSVNTVPDRCTIEVDLRPLPDQPPDEAYQEAVAFLAQEGLAAPQVVHDPPFMLGHGLSDARNRALADRLAAIASEVTGACRQVGVPYATDAAFFAAAGVPSVVFGPGALGQAHTADEWIALDEVDQAAEILDRFGRAVWSGSLGR